MWHHNQANRNRTDNNEKKLQNNFFQSTMSKTNVRNKLIRSYERSLLKWNISWQSFRRTKSLYPLINALISKFRGEFIKRMISNANVSKCQKFENSFRYTENLRAQYIVFRIENEYFSVYDRDPHSMMICRATNHHTFFQMTL